MNPKTTRLLLVLAACSPDEWCDQMLEALEEGPLGMTGCGESARDPSEGASVGARQKDEGGGGHKGAMLSKKQ